MTTAPFDTVLRRHAAERPSATAVLDLDARLTYAQLDDAVALVEAQVTGAGVKPGDRVVLIADNTVHHLAVAFGLWRAGATLVTIYPSSTEAELAFAIDNAQPTLVIAGTRISRTVRAVTTGLDVPVAELAASGDLIGLADPGAEVEPARIDPESPALICYTSGSTARPKAVMHSHAGLAAGAASYAAVWHLDHDDVTLVALPLAWAFGLVTTSMATLTGGGQVLLLARSEPEHMLTNFVDHGVTMFAGVTTMYVKMVAALERDPARTPPNRLRLCISGGEPRNDAVFDRWRTLTGCPVHDVYAASECFPVVTSDPHVDPLPTPGSAGRVVPDAQLRLVRPDGEDAALGEPGEAWVRGPALMLGYWRDEDLGRAALTPDGWYRTGDLVELDADGCVRIVGRLSDLIIRSGANVSPAEVESVLVRHPVVREATVVGLPDAEHGEQVVAAVVVDPDASVDEAELRAHCAISLAGYKVPTRVVAVPQIPRNANTGKVQRRDVATLLASLVGTGSADR